jgi:YesN/AraC family two-component response regulator
MCLQVGMDDYLSKPVDKAAFYEMLQRYAHQKQQRIRSNMLNQRYALTRGSKCHSFDSPLFLCANTLPTGALREAIR